MSGRWVGAWFEYVCACGDVCQSRRPAEQCRSCAGYVKPLRKAPPAPVMPRWTKAVGKRVA